MVHYIKITKTVTRTTDGEGRYDRYDYNRPNTYQNVVVEGFEVVGEKDDWNFIIKHEPREEYYLVWCSYNSGDSFGVDYGYYDFTALVSTRADAELIAKTIANDYEEDKTKLRVLSVTLSDGSVEKIHTSAWKGYMDRLTDIRVETVQRGSRTHIKIY